MSHQLFMLVFLAVVVLLLFIDLFILHRRPRIIGTRRALYESAMWIAVALVFNLLILLSDGWRPAIDFLTCYLVEKALSVDNLFVFLVIFSYFGVQPKYQHRVLFYGVLGAILMRAVFIVAGVALIALFHWVLYLFGAFLIYAGVRMLRQSAERVDPSRNPVLRLARRYLPLSSQFQEGRFFVQKNGAWFATPMFVVLLVVEFTDLVFAFDSIPAAFAITQDPFIVFTSNIMAVLGLRALFFALAGLLRMFERLHYGLSVVLIFIGTKVLVADFVTIPVTLSLALVLGAIAISIILSPMVLSRQRQEERAPATEDSPPHPSAEPQVQETEEEPTQPWKEQYGRGIALIVRREWRAYVGSWAGLFVILLYLLLAGYLFALNVSVTQEATMRHTFATLGVLTIFVIPLITMRLLAEELRSGTFEVLATHPLTDVQIVLGKFLAGWLIFLALSLPTLSYLVVLGFLGSPDWGPALAGYLGQQLLAAMLVAMGVLASAATPNLVLAAMGAMVGGILFWLAGTAAISIRGWLGDALAYLAIFDHFALFRRGILDTRTLVFFVATTAVFLFLAVRVVESRRYKFGVVPGSAPRHWVYPRLSLALLVLAVFFLAEALVSSTRRDLSRWSDLAPLAVCLMLVGAAGWVNRAKLGYELGRRQAGLALAVAANCLLAIAIWAMATYLSSRHFLRVDLTSARRYTLAEQTRNVIRNLNAPLEIVSAVNQPADLQQEVRDLLTEYSALSRMVSVRYLNPQASPAEAELIRERYKLSSPLASEVLVAVGDRSRRIPAGSLAHQPTRVVEGRRVRLPAQFLGEAEITAAIIQLTSAQPGRITFLSGHGERDIDDPTDNGALTVASELRRNGWIVDRWVVTPGAGAQLPEDTRVLVIAGAQRSLSDENLRAANTLLERGGGLLVLLDPGIDCGLAPFLEPWGVRLADNLVVDRQQYVASADPTSLYVTRFNQESPIGKGMGSLAVVLPTARRIAVAGEDVQGVRSLNFMHTSGDSWAVPYQTGERIQIDPKRDKRGPISLGMAIERYQEYPEPGRSPLLGRLVVIGDSEFMSNRYVDLAGNLDLFLNCIDWLAGRHDLISVRPKVADTRWMPLSPRQQRFVFWWSILILPGLAMVLGIHGMTRQRRNR